MKLFNLTVRNVITLSVVIVLALAMLWLVRRQPVVPLTAQSDEATPPATTTPPPSPTPQAITTPALVGPTETLTPTLTSTASPLLTPTPSSPPLTPIRTTPYLAFAATPEPGPTYTPRPIVTATPTPVPAVHLVSDEPLLSLEHLAQMQVRDRQHIWVEAWPSEDEFILGVGYGSPTYWTFSRTSNTVQPLPRYSASSRLEAAAREELRQFDQRVDYVEVSPDGQWAGWGQGQTLLIKQLRTNTQPTNLLGIKEFETFQRGSGRLVWTSQSNKLAYVVENGYQHRFEIRISDPLGTQTTIIPFKSFAPSEMAWSPDGQYLAFSLLEDRPSGSVNLYVVKSDGKGLTELIDHGVVNGPILWSPTGEAIIYNYDTDRAPWVAKIAQ